MADATPRENTVRCLDPHGFHSVRYLEWGDPARSVYGERIRSAERVIRESLPRAPKPELVARAIHHALTARRPRVRYAVGREALAVTL